MLELKTDNEIESPKINSLKKNKVGGREYVDFHDENVKIKKRKSITIF